MSAAKLDLRSSLSAAIDVLGDVMLEMQRRELLKRPAQTAHAIELLTKKILTDEELGARAAAAFEAGTLALIATGHPDTRAISCSPTDEDLP